jgi:hypothetical protein
VLLLCALCALPLSPSVSLLRYLRLAVTARKGFVAFDELIGDQRLGSESDDPIQRDIDQRLNVYNMYDSVPALVGPVNSPAFGDVPSKLVNPIALRIKHQGRRVPSERPSAGVAAVLETAAADDQESSGDELAPVLAVEEDASGEGDDGVLFEVAKGAVLRVSGSSDSPFCACCRWK